MTAHTKAHIAEHLHVNLGLSKKESGELVQNFFEVISKFLESGENVKLSSFGNFVLRDKGERPGRNPKTGEEIPITPRRVVTFKPGQKLRARVTSYAGDQQHYQ